MRITKVTTKTGDMGETSMGDGKRVSKDHPAMVFQGDLDELNSHIGLALAVEGINDWSEPLLSIQQDIFNIGGEASMPNTDVSLLKKDRISFLESAIETMNSELPPLKEFILPGGNQFCAHLHVVRAACRRAERSCVTLLNNGEDVKLWLQYLNRLSDYIFVLARCVHLKLDGQEELWQREK